MNQIFQPLVNKCVFIYFNDILIYISNVETHLAHLQNVFDILKKQNLFANPKKCHFLTNNKSFLGFILSLVGIEADPNKVEAIIRCSKPQ